MEKFKWIDFDPVADGKVKPKGALDINCDSHHQFGLYCQLGSGCQPGQDCVNYPHGCGPIHEDCDLQTQGCA